MSSEGHVVIPASMRSKLPAGERLLIIRDGERIILKPLSAIEPAVREDILFAKKTEEALEEYSRGTFARKKVTSFKDGLKEW